MPMMLRIENWEGYEIRFVYVDGEWWAVAKDVADALGYSDTRQMTRRMDEDEVSSFNWKKEQLETEDAERFSDYKYKAEVPIISETGIYEAILNSRRKEAREFKRWVKQLLKMLREKSGLEGFQVFLMTDKEHNNKVMAEIQANLPNAKNKDYIKVHQVTNKVVSSLFGFDKPLKKNEMPPEMLKARQPILEEAKDLHIMKEKYGLDFSVSETLKKRWLNSQTHYNQEPNGGQETPH